MKLSIQSKSKRVRGYRIHIWRGSQYEPPSITTPLVWRESPPIEEFQQAVNDPSTQQAWIIQSGRKMRQFQFRRSEGVH